MTTEETKHQIDKVGKRNKGFMWERIKNPHSYREKLLLRYWQKECKPQAAINSGHGILQDLFANARTSSERYSIPKWHLWLTNREKYIVATVIQWLGTNCGFCAFQEMAREMGYDLIMNEKGKKLLKDAQKKIQKEQDLYFRNKRGGEHG